LGILLKDEVYQDMVTSFVGDKLITDPEAQTEFIRAVFTTTGIEIYNMIQRHMLIRRLIPEAFAGLASTVQYQLFGHCISDPTDFYGNPLVIARQELDASQADSIHPVSTPKPPKSIYKSPPATPKKCTRLP
jgi:hypothetical protein